MKIDDEELARLEHQHCRVRHKLACGARGKYMIERLAVCLWSDYASEYRYRNPIPDRNALGLLITQSVRRRIPWQRSGR